MRSSRWLALPATALSLVFVTGAAATPARTLPIRTVAVEQKRQTAAEKQQVARTATLLAETMVSTWTCQDRLGVTRSLAKHSPWALGKHSPGFRAALLSKWSQKRNACKEALQERKRQWNWQAFPRWIVSLAVCESGGSGGQPSGFPNWWAEATSSDGSFYSAFNIGRTRYDLAAHHMGVRGWSEGAGIPSPYEQAMAVIGYVRTYGDGFSGRCAGIARSTWD